MAMLVSNCSFLGHGKVARNAFYGNRGVSISVSRGASITFSGNFICGAVSPPLQRKHPSADFVSVDEKVGVDASDNEALVSGIVSDIGVLL